MVQYCLNSCSSTHADSHRCSMMIDSHCSAVLLNSHESPMRFPKLQQIFQQDQGEALQERMIGCHCFDCCSQTEVSSR